MRIAVSAQGKDLQSLVDPRFGRTAYFIIYDTDTEAVEVISNSENVEAAQGAGVQSAQLVVRQKIQVVVSGNMGPKAFQALQEAGIKIVTWDRGTVREAVELIQSGKYQEVDGANVRGHWR